MSLYTRVDGRRLAKIELYAKEPTLLESISCSTPKRPHVRRRTDQQSSISLFTLTFLPLYVHHQ